MKKKRLCFYYVEDFKWKASLSSKSQLHLSWQTAISIYLVFAPQKKNNNYNQQTIFLDVDF